MDPDLLKVGSESVFYVRAGLGLGFIKGSVLLHGCLWNELNCRLRYRSDITQGLNPDPSLLKGPILIRVYCN